MLGVRPLMLVLLVGAMPDCESMLKGGSAPAAPVHRPLPLDEEVLLDKDVTYAVGDTGITVINRGRGMTIEEGGHKVFATLDVAKGDQKASLSLKGWKGKPFAGHTFALTGIGEKHGGSDVKVRVTKR